MNRATCASVIVQHEGENAAADGVVRAAMSGLFDDDEIDESMTKFDRAALLDMIRKNRKLFKAQHYEDLERQKQH